MLRSDVDLYGSDQLRAEYYAAQGAPPRPSVPHVCRGVLPARAEPAIVALSALPREEQSWAYLLRLAAFALISIGILYKNIMRRSNPR